MLYISLFYILSSLAVCIICLLKSVVCATFFILFVSQSKCIVCVTVYGLLSLSVRICVPDSIQVV